MKNSQAVSIKARVYNKLRKWLYKQELKDFTSENKAAFFDELFKLNKEAHNELNNLKSKRRLRRKVEAERAKKRAVPGYVPKKKMSLEEYNRLMEHSAMKVAGM